MDTPHVITELDASQTSRRTREGSLSAEAIAQACLTRISERDAAVGAWASVEPERVIAAARELDARSVRGPLHGVPIGIKDVIQTADMPTGHGSPIYEGHRPNIDAAVVATLRHAGALLFGKTTTVEFAAMGHKPNTRHPANPERSPGGTSSGSAAAVADRQVPVALGTQTAGSTIRPASFCGIHAFKPTWGLVSREGVKQFSLSLDTVSWFARSIDDLELLCDVFAVGDGPAERPSIDRLVIGVCTPPAWNSASPAVHEAFEAAREMLTRAGVRMIDVNLPSTFQNLHSSALTVLMGEGRAAFLAEARSYPERLHPDYLRVLHGDRSVSDAQMIEAQNHGAACRMQFDVIAKGFDAIITLSAGDEGAGRRRQHGGRLVQSDLEHASCSVCEPPGVGRLRRLAGRVDCDRCSRG